MITVGSAAREQQALDATLGSGPGAPVGAFWHCPQPALVLGRGQKAGADTQKRATAAGWEITRRLTGGGAVVAGPWMLSQFVVVPATHALARMSLPDSFETVGTAWCRALAAHGVAASMVVRDGVRERAARFRASSIGWVCFAGHSYGELTDGAGAKVLGLAQVRRRTAMAVVAGLLMREPPWRRLVEIWLGASGEDQLRDVTRATATVCGMVGADSVPDMASLAASVAREMADLSIDWSGAVIAPT